MGLNHETRDIDLRPIVLFAVALLIALVGVFWVSKRLHNRLAQHGTSYPSGSPLAAERQQPTGPKLAVNLSFTMEQQRTAEEKQLRSYGITQ